MTAWTIHQGDALAILSALDADSVDCVIADPPYNSGGRTSSERRNQSARGKYVSSDAGHALADFAGDNRDQRGYLAWLTMILAECLRVSRTGASAMIFTDWRQLPVTSDALQAAGWTWRGVVPWYKPNNRPRRGAFRQSCEFVIWGSNGPVDADRHPVILPGLVEGSQPSGKVRQHITQKPVPVLREMVKICPPGSVVLDPFAGAGSAGVAALAEGRDYLGIELTEHYAAVARGRLASAAAEGPARRNA